MAKQVKLSQRLWILGSISLFIFVAFFSYTKIRKHGADIAGRIILEIIKKESNNYYQISYEKVEVSIYERKLRIQNLLMQPDSLFEATAADPIPVNSFSILIPEVNLRFESFLAIFFKEELKIISLKVVDPAITMLRTNEPDKKRPFSLEAGDLYLIISQYLKLFKIETFNIEEGSFAFDKTPQIKDSADFNINSLHFSLDNFIIDQGSKSGKKSIFFSEAIELVINDQVIYLSDSIHHLSFKRLTISTEDEFIKFDGIKVGPIQDPNKDSGTVANVNYYDIDIPTLHLRGVDFHKAYLENSLKIDSIGILNPKILLVDKVRNRNKKEASSSSIGALLVDYFDNVAVRQLTLKNGLVDLDFQAGEKTQQIRLESANINIGNFKVDSLVFDKMGSYKYFDDIAVDFSKYKFLLPDSVHQLYLDNFHLSTSEGIIRADSVTLSPRADVVQSSKTNLYQAYFPSVALRSFDWHTMATNKEIAVGSLTLPKPNIKLRFNTNRDAKEAPDYERIAATLFPYLKTLEFDSIILDDGRLHFSDLKEELVGLEHVRLLLLKFKFNEKSINDSKRLLFSEAIKLRFEDFSVETPDKRHLIKLSKFDFDSKRNRIVLDKLNIKPIHTNDKEHPISISGSVDQFEFNGLAFQKLKNNQHLLLNHLKVVKPNIDIVMNRVVDTLNSKTGTPDKMNWLSHLSVKHFEVLNGSVRYANEKEPILNIGNFSISGEEFSLDSAMLKDRKLSHQMEKFSLMAKQITYLAHKQEHVLKLGSFGIAQDQGRLAFTNLEIAPMNGKTPENAIVAKTPELLLYGVDIEDLLINKNLDASTIIFKKPTIEITALSKADSLKTQKTLSEIYAAISVNIRKIKLDNTLVEEANLRLNTPDGSIIITGIDAWVDYFKLGSSFNFDYDNPFFAQNYILSAKSVQSVWKGNRPQFSAINLSLNVNSGTLNLDSFKISNSDTLANSFKIVAPNIALAKFDFARWYEKGEMIGGSVTVNQPQVYTHQDERNFESFVMPEKIVLPFPLIGIEKIAIVNGKLTREVGNGKEALTRTFTNLNANLTKFKYDTTLSLRKQLLYSENAYLSGKNLDFVTKDSLFSVNFDKYELRTNPSSVTLTGTTIEPKYNKFAFSAMVGHQTDWAKASIGTVTLKIIDLERLLYHQELLAHKVGVDSLSISLFRDKKWPRLENIVQRMPQVALGEFETPIAIDTFALSNSYLQYEELAEESSAIGKIYFDDLTAQILNIVNTPVKLSANKNLSGSISAKLMGEGTVTVMLKAPLTNENGTFTLAGTLSPMSLVPLTEMLGPVAFIKIKNGTNENLIFELNANDSYAQGSMKFYYKNLKVSLLSKKGEDNIGMGNAIGSFFANTFIVRSNNPSIFLLRNGDIYFERDASKSIFNYWSKSVLSGVISSIGAKNNKREIKRKNKEALQIKKDRIREEKYLEDKIGIYE
jgi:hypothetical protein